MFLEWEDCENLESLSEAWRPCFFIGFKLDRIFLACRGRLGVLLWGDLLDFLAGAQHSKGVFTIYEGQGASWHPFYSDLVDMTWITGNCSQAERCPQGGTEGLFLWCSTTQCIQLSWCELNRATFLTAVPNLFRCSRDRGIQDCVEGRICSLVGTLPLQTYYSRLFHPWNSPFLKRMNSIL